MTSPQQPSTEPAGKDQPHPNHDRGLEFDLSTLLSRRRTLGVLFGAGTAAALAACTPGTGGSNGSSATPSSTSSATVTATESTTAAASPSASSTVTRALAECGVEIPEETLGPYPGDGSNGPNVLEASGVVRRDIRSSFGASTTKAEGVPLTVTLTLLDNANGCSPLAGAAVYAWHCDQNGKYSLYDPGLENENYLRGVQETDANGQLTFSTIYPGAYNGRWPHIHFEVFESMSNTSAAGQVLTVSQIALTDKACKEVYATAGYESSARNFPNTTLTSDNVFGDDGGIYQLATMSGSVAGGYTAALNVTV
ncbi:Dioxygenase [Arthrobacter sp. cf158]|uniref:intradiol ring-cleavage dioxygenase n=1 Tax=Arthrobacter sp. cf158 TaxID=1761744 RepID=UPI00089B7805|nr:intradiol ring-cleavage dioxygenase [Arthrobacter sp. cf158]SDX00781.1 Dioxygenase [Arthrobacter sp. cf158]